jgi:hypothetical protein
VKKILLIILGILVVLIIVFLIWNQILLNKSEERACTEEAKLCSDGTAVGRTGPNCEFAECPTVNCIDKCGDGVCQEVVCEAIGCPCVETKITCPSDCEQ